MDGFELLNALNTFVSDHASVILNDTAYRAAGVDPDKLHPSIARGNNKTSIPELPVQLAFGGDLHAQMRSMMGGLGALVDNDSLPSEVKKLRAEVDNTRADYLAHVKVLRDIVDGANAQNNNSEKRIYDSLDSLYEQANMLDRPVTRQEHHIIDRITEKYDVAYQRLNLLLDDYDKVPLRVKAAGKGQIPEVFVTASLQNKKKDKVSLLRLLVLDKMVKDVQASTIHNPKMIAHIGTQEGIISNVDAQLFGALKENQDAQEFTQALNENLLAQMKAYLQLLEKKYGAGLAQAYPDVYKDFSAIRNQLDLIDGQESGTDWRSKFPQPAIEDHTEKTSDNPSKCPYHQAIRTNGSKSGSGTPSK